LTYKCNRSCCFAQERHKALSPDEPWFISWKNLVTAVNYFAEAREDTVTVLGGEPFLHPDFINVYRYLQARGFTVRMLSNGCMSHEKIEALLRVVVLEKSRFIINVNEEPDRLETKMQDAFFRELGMVSSLSFNLQGPDHELDFLLDLIGEYQLRPRIRLGMAHPIAGELGEFVTPAQYGDISEKITNLAKRCDQQGVIVSLDCGFTLCDFTDEQLGTLRRSNANLKFRCGPIIDIGPDLNTWACFALSNLRPQPLEEFPGFGALRKFYAEYIRAETRKRGFAGVYEKCEACRYRKRGQCTGGCRSYAFEETN
jgi:hypothetical protein